MRMQAEAKVDLNSDERDDSGDTISLTGQVEIIPKEFPPPGNNWKGGTLEDLVHAGSAGIQCCTHKRDTQVTSSEASSLLNGMQGCPA